MRLEVTASALRELLHEHFELAPIVLEVHRLGSADFLIDLWGCLYAGRPRARQVKRDPLDQRPPNTMRTGLSGSLPVIRRKESLKWQIA
jgi:hypothetical protein